MGLKQFEVSLSSLGESKHCRLDEKYSFATAINDWKVFQSDLPQLSLSYYLEELPSNKIKKGELDSEFYLINISDQVQRSGELENVDKTMIVGSDKNNLSDSDIIISKLGMPKGYIFINKYKGESVLGSSELIPYKINANFDHRLLKYLLLHPKTLKMYEHLESGKTPSHRRVNPYELLQIKIPFINEKLQIEISNEILKIENRIEFLKKKLIKPKTIINKIFGNEFNISYSEYEQESKQRIFNINLSDIPKNRLNRISCHHHHIKLKYIEEKISDPITWQPVSSKFKLSGGKRVPKGDDLCLEPTPFGYLRPNEIDIWGIKPENLQYISDKVYKKLERYKIKTGDFGISIVGTLGKTILVDTNKLNIEEDNLILSENFIKLTPINDEINKKFYYYYFYSFIFEAQLNREYTITSIKKLGIDKWSYIKIPQTSIHIQNEIVFKLEKAFKEQVKLKKEIRKERNKIDELIINSL